MRLGEAKECGRRSVGAVVAETMNGEQQRGGGGGSGGGGVGSSEPPLQLAGPPHQLPPHQLLGLAGLVAGTGMAGMGAGMANSMTNMTMHGPTIMPPAPDNTTTSITSSSSSTGGASTSTSGGTVPRTLPTTSPSAVVGGLMTGGGLGGNPPGSSVRPPLPQALLNMEPGSGGIPWGGPWGDLQDGLGLERGRSRNWTYEETVELISLYTSEEWQAKFSSEKKNHRAIWASLAAALTRRRDVSGDEARQRLNNLKALYNRTRRQLLAGEISSPQWEYWEPLHAFLGRPQPYIPITATPSSTPSGSMTPSRPHHPPPPPLHGFPQHFQYHSHHHHHQQQQHHHQHHPGSATSSFLDALGFSHHHMNQPRDAPGQRAHYKVCVCESRS